jgi:hypothetical protein
MGKNNNGLFFANLMHSGVQVDNIKWLRKIAFLTIPDLPFLINPE